MLPKKLVDKDKQDMLKTIQRLQEAAEKNLAPRLFDIAELDDELENSASLDLPEGAENFFMIDKGKS